MEAFGDDYTVHNLPLLLLSGVERRPRAHSSGSQRSQPLLHEGGFRVRTDLPPVDSDIAAELLEAFLAQDGSEAPWKAQASAATQTRWSRMRCTGRVFTFPPRKAPPPPHSPRTSAVGSNGPPPSLVLHSPLSPLTPSSPLYPDGIITPHWIAKHQYQLPSALLVFFTLTADHNTSSLLDNKIKSEINNIRSVIASTNYKTRLAIVLLADGAFDALDLEERLSTLRKATSLDTKSLYFLPASASHVEVNEFVRTILSALQPLCIEYYRDLSKHARRKRNRSSTPQPTVPPVSAHLLPNAGWNVRYEFKLGVFAEFRQEMDAACRNYESAYEHLFAPEMIETIHVWSPRFNEARMLADVIAIRILRCLLWTGQTTSAVRTWTAHRDRIRDLVSRRGRGTETYAWEAWQSLWSKTMAELISRSELAVLNTKQPQTLEFVSLFAGPEKSTAVGDRIAPWELLHHEGYWLELARKHTQARRNRANAIPTEDRQSPEQSPASAIANKAQTYDTYMALEPHAEMAADSRSGFNHASEIISILDAATKHFENRKQDRMLELLHLKLATEQLRAEAWNEAVEILLPLWTSQRLRKAGWWTLLWTIGWALLDCARKLQDSELLTRLGWELNNPIFEQTPGQLAKAPWPESNSSAASLNVEESLSQISTTFAFVSEHGHVGEPLDCQLVFHSLSQSRGSPILVTEVKVVFEGALKPIYLTGTNDDERGPAVEALDVTLQDTSRMSNTSRRSSVGALSSLTGEANLIFMPGQTRIFNLQVLPREAGEVSVAAITLTLEIDGCRLFLTLSELENHANEWWEARHGFPLRRLVGPERVLSKVEILPKPPKVELTAANFNKTYYTNESIELHLDVSNNEEEAVSMTIGARLISPAPGAAVLEWLDERGSAGNPGADELIQALPSRELPDQPPGSKLSLTLLITETVAALDHELEVTVSYRLESDPDSLLQKTLTLDIVVIRPFEANYDFLPRLIKEQWPNFFEMPQDIGSSTVPLGLRQQSLVMANLFSFATDPIIIEAILLTTAQITGGAVASSTTGVLKDALPPSTASEAPISTQIEPETTRSFNFDLSVQKHVLGDRHTVALDLFLEIGWRRTDSDRVNTSILEVPQFVMPMAEPRVLFTTEKSTAVSSDTKLYTLTYTIENPSMHFLTFNMTMESSDEYAFSGPKACAVSLVPVSRHEVKYRILPHKRKEWLKVGLGVVDAYFNQTLKVFPASEGVKGDKKGGIWVWVD